MTKEDEILRQLAALNRLIGSNNKEIMGKFADGEKRFTRIDMQLIGDGGLNEGVVPMLKRHDKHIAELIVKESKPLEGFWGWAEKNEKTIKIGIFVYLIVFHAGLAAKLLKFI